jgi:hypothetical protein
MFTIHNIIYILISKAAPCTLKRACVYSRPFLYYHLLLGSPPETRGKIRDRFEGWDGGEGVIEHIMATFDFQTDEKTRVRKVLEGVREYASRVITYQGQIIKDKGQNPLVTAPQEYQIIIDSMEKGLGLVTAIYQINEYH